MEDEGEGARGNRKRIATNFFSKQNSADLARSELQRARKLGKGQHASKPQNARAHGQGSKKLVMPNAVLIGSESDGDRSDESAMNISAGLNDDEEGSSPRKVCSARAVRLSSSCT